MITACDFVRSWTTVDIFWGRNIKQQLDACFSLISTPAMFFAEKNFPKKPCCHLYIYNNDINVLSMSSMLLSYVKPILSLHTHILVSHPHPPYFSIFSFCSAERLISVPKKVVISDSINRMVHALNYHTF